MVALTKNFNNIIKVSIRQKQVNFYKKATGNNVLPPERQYWTLSHIQNISPESEINWLYNNGFLEKSQFVGVDNDEEKILINKINHPEAKWVSGDILQAVWNYENFNPGIFYFDTISSIENQQIIALTRKLMSPCPVENVFFANFVMRNYRRNIYYTENALIKSLFNTNYLRSRWEFCGSCEYIGEKVPMKTFAFFRVK